MNTKGRIFTLAVLALLVLATGMTLFTASNEVAGEETQAAMAKLHVNLKASDKLQTETKAPDAAGEQLWVQATFDEYPGTRANKDWSDVGTWSSASREGAFKMGGAVTFNVWFSIRDEGYDADPEFRFTLNVDGTNLITSTGAIMTDPGDDRIMEYKVNGNFDAVDVATSSAIDLKIEYRAWEDCDVYFDNASYDSGFFVGGDFLQVFSYGGSGDKITAEVYDAWGADWDKTAYHIDISVDGTKESKPGFITKVGGKYDDIQSTLIQWTIMNDLEAGQNVSLWIKYSPADVGEDYGFEKGFEVGASGTGGGGSTGGGDDDDSSDDNTIIYVGGAVGGLVIFGAVFMFVIKPKMDARKEDEDDDEDWDEDDEEDDDEDYEDDEEMDYE